MSYIKATVAEADGAITAPTYEGFADAGYISDTQDTVMQVLFGSPATGDEHFATKKGVIGAMAAGFFAPALMPKAANTVYKTVGIKKRVS